jgi:hypothetical protein
MPDTISDDGHKKHLLVGSGFIECVEPAMWEVRTLGQAGGRAVVQLSESESGTAAQPDNWLAEYTTELVNLLNVLGLLVGP